MHTREDIMISDLVKSDIKEALKICVVHVSFEKKDGTIREMTCTTDLGGIAEEFHPKGTGKPSTDEVQKVFDLDINQWRSFRWDSLKSAKWEFPGGTKVEYEVV